MASNNSKRVEVSPGVYINISKSGLNRAAGVRGTSSALGKKGVYVNTGYPGSGYYTRPAISEGRHKMPRTVAQPETTAAAGKGSSNAGCAMLTAFLVCAIVAISGGGMLWWIGAAVAMCAGIAFFGKDGASKDKGGEKGADYLSEARTARDKATDASERRILESFIDSCEVVDKIDDEERIIEKLNENPDKNAERIGEHQMALAELRGRLEAAQYEVDAEVSEVESAAYAKMCEAFENLQDCEKVWLITSQQAATQSQGAATAVVRRPGCVYSGVFNYLRSQYDIPALEVSGGTLYLYPKFAILAQRPGAIQVAPYADVNIMSTTQKFNEKDGVPGDAEAAGFTWRHVDERGNADPRYADNEQIPVAIYGKLTIRFKRLIYTFHFSNYDKTKDFAQAFASYKGAIGENNSNDGDANANRQKRADELKERIKGATDQQNKVTQKQKSKLDFILALSSATKLYEELAAMSGDKQVLDALERYPAQLDAMKKLTVPRLDSRVGVLGAMAAIKCFEKLGHADVDTDEGMALSLFLSQILTPDQQAVWSNEEKMRSPQGNAMRHTAYDVFKNNIHISFDEDKILLIELLRKEGVEEATVNRFAVLLYRFARVIGEADASISATEKDWLVKLLSFTAPADGGQGATTRGGRKPTEGKGAVLPPVKGDALKELTSLIGLGSVKTEVESIYNLIKIQKVRESKGLKSSSISYHCVFTGNPGTGKTTVARLVAQIYKELGLLTKGHLVETDRSGLVAEYVGQTAVKTNKIIDTALDGVLFIDEAYSLVQGGKNDFGMEAISTLLKRMEDDRERLVVILAGYSNEMKQFIDANPGLQSRFNRYIHFEDYNADDLEAIYGFNLKKYDYRLSEDGKKKLRETISTAVANKDKNFGNARYIRNLFEKTLENQARRLASVTELSEDVLTEIKGEDIPDYK